MGVVEAPDVSRESVTQFRLTSFIGHLGDPSPHSREGPRQKAFTTSSRRASFIVIEKVTERETSVRSEVGSVRAVPTEGAMGAWSLCGWG